MKKNTGKVLSLVLALAMVVTSFSATFVSASTVEVAGTKGRVEKNAGYGDEFKAVSDKYDDYILIEDLDKAYELQSMDRESLDEYEYVSFSKKSGDSLVKVAKDSDDKDKKNLYLKKNASGKETIVLTYKGTYTDDDTDKEVTVRGSIEVDIIAYAEGEVKLAPVGDYEGDHPDDLDTIAVNDSGMEIALYMAAHKGEGKDVLGNADPKWEMIDVIADSSMNIGENGKVAKDEDGYFKLSSSKVFAEEADADNNNDNAVSSYKDKVITLAAIKTDKEGKDTGIKYYAKVATTKIEMYAPKITVDEDGPDATSLKKGDKIKETVGVGKKWSVDGDNGMGNVVSKIGARTVIGTADVSDEKYSDEQNNVKIVTGYEMVMNGGSLSVVGGTIGDITGTAKGVSVDNATVGNIDAGDDADNAIVITGGKVGDIKDGASVNVSEGASVASIASIVGEVVIEGATVSGSVATDGAITITGTEDDKTSISGDVKGKDAIEVTADDGAVAIKGVIKANSGEATISLSGNLLSVGSIDADYWDTAIDFSEYKGKIAFTNVATATVNLVDDSTVTVDNDNKMILASVDIEEGSTFTIAGEAKITDISGDGMLAINSDKLFVNGGIDGVQVKLLDSPANGKVALRAETDTVGADDFIPVGFTAKVVAQNSSIDKIVVDTVKFAGLSFDKTEATIAKGYTADVTVAPYPAGTALPEGAKIAWNLEGDDAYINYTLNAAGDTATVKVVDFNTDYAYSNKATLTATIVDEDGYEIEGYVAAVCDIQGVAVPDTSVTLDTKTVTKNVGEIYQFIAKSSDGSAVTAASSDESVAKVALYDANDARGYKFQINAVGAGTATITVKNAVGASATMTVTVVAGQATLKIDTTSYKMAPGNIYDFKVTTTGTTAVPVVTDSRNGSIVTLTDLGGGKYRITGRNVGTAFITATIGDTRCSLKVEVAAGATQGGVTGNNVSIIK